MSAGTVRATGESPKVAAARAALELVEDGMLLGLGTGSTAAEFVTLLGQRVKAGLRVVGVPTSVATAAQAGSLGIPLTTLDAVGALDLTIDGTDEIDPEMRLIKGGGGALLREKIVAAASERMVVIADASKKVATLGAFPLPIEIVRFGAEATIARVAECLEQAEVERREIAPRRGAGGLFITDEGNQILDLHLGRIGNPACLDRALNAVPGVVETGIFSGIASLALIGNPDGTVERIA
jgi:ribose 5-phosphate isomerase A